MKTKTSLLIILIAVLGTFIYLKVQSLGSMDNQFNQTTRYKLGRYGWLRTLFSLHKDGDARAWYLSKSPGALAVEVVHPQGQDISSFALNDFAAKVQKYLGRPVQVYNTETIKGGKLTSADLAEIDSQKRRYDITGQPDLLVVYAEDFDGSEQTIGTTYREYGVVLSYTKLEGVAGGNGRAMDEYVESTLLHEFGHQLGLDHNDGNGCIMRQEVESPKTALMFGGSYTATDYCQQEINQINQLKAQYQ